MTTMEHQYKRPITRKETPIRKYTVLRAGEENKNGK
jgi:hypothetical protein